MLFTEPMKGLELLVLKSDADSVLRYLGFAGCLQLIAEPREARDLAAEEHDTAELRQKLQALARFLGAEELPSGTRAVEAPDRAELARRASELLAAARPLIDEETALVQRRLRLTQSADGLSAYRHLGVPLADISDLSHLAVRMGSLSPERLPEVERNLEGRAVIIPLATPGFLLAVSARKGRWALDSELARCEFQPVQLPQERTGLPAEILAGIQAELEQTEGVLSGLEARKQAFRAEREHEMGELAAELELCAAIDAAKQGLASSGSVQKVTGWIPRRRLAEVTDRLQSLTGGRIALRVFDPQELPDVKAGRVKVPVSTPHGRVVRGFDRMVFSYGVPLYGTVDPTPFVAVMFIILFAIMFGDVGQGFVGLVIGLLIASGRVPSFESYRRKHFGTTFILVGAASMVSGFLYGSFFANEHVLEPLSRAVTGALVGRPIDHVISLQGFQKIILFFGVTIGIGAVINSIGLLINILNMARRGDWEEALLSKTGAAGALFFWYVLFVAVRMVAHGAPLGIVDLVAIAIPLLALVFRHPLVHAIRGHRPLLKDGLFAFVMEGIVEILESTIYYVSNSVSFLRVAAFALAHTVLSTIIFLLSDMVAGAPAGLVYRILVILIGNSIIIVLEGLIVTIQVVRLQYYEFFSKFFGDTGEQFSPFILRSSGGVK